MDAKTRRAEQQRLIDAYERLDVGIQGVVQVAAVIKPTARTHLISAAARAGAKHADGRASSYTADRDAINEAIDLGVLEFVKTKNGPVRVAPLIDDYVFRQAFRQGIAQESAKISNRARGGASWIYAYDQREILYDMRMAFYGRDHEQWHELVRHHEVYPYVLDPFCLDDFQELSPELQQDLFEWSVEGLISEADACRSDFATQAVAILDSMPKLSESTIVAAIDLFAARGDLAQLRSLAERVKTPRSEIQGCLDFLQGNYEDAQRQFEAALAERKKKTRKRRVELPHLPSVFYALLLLRENSASSQQILKQLIKAIDDWENRYRSVSTPLQDALDLRISPTSNRVLLFFEAGSKLGLLLTGWIWCWLRSDESPNVSRVYLEQTLEAYQASGMDWLAAELSAVLARMPIRRKKKQRQAYADQFHAERKTQSLVEFIRPLAPWEAALTALENLCGTSDQNAADDHNTERLIWELEYVANSPRVSLTPFVQKRGKNGWSKGRKVGLGRLYSQWESPNFDFLTDQDRAICRLLHERVERNYYGYRETFYEWNQSRIGPAIIGHPHLFLPDERDEPLQVTESRPHLTIEQTKQGVKLAVQPKWLGESNYVQALGSHRVSIVQFSDRQAQVAEMVTLLPTIPAAEVERVASIAQSLSSIIDVQSDVEGTPSSGEEVDASAQIVAQLTPYQDGLRAELFVQPLGEHGPFCRPGVGARAVFATVDGKSLTTTRDLQDERECLQQLFAGCRSLDCRMVSDEQTEWLFHEAEDALELVVELQSLAEHDQVRVLWPRGKSHDVAGNATTSNFRLAVKRDREWFAASGDLKVDDELTLDLMQLVELVSGSPSRFVQLTDGRFLSLTKELRQRIGDIAAYGTMMKNKVRFSPVRALVVDELLEDTNFKADKHWKSHIDRIEEASQLAVEPPSTLQAELRDYQRVGYAWLKRMTHWSTGACLADDMGLGKTIQAIALLIDRSTDGPALVVAPASVGFNWESEIRKFAPTLVPKVFRDCDRDQFFQNLEVGDVVITSYGLLQSEVERFEEVQWKTVLLDEAQAIKNMATKRSQAVMKLESEFRLILTGTPLENHLGELWNLFRFIVPGLLGSNESFRQRFALPIERDQCRQSQNRLKKLIQPFLLRRTKAEVLSELPSRSESLLEVELSPAETALYEALRRKAIEKIEEAAADAPSQGQQHLQVLAELTRLRLACCHPSLVGGEGIESSKLDLFRCKISEIIEGKHKVLVFSQFVKHLEILREELATMGVAYQYLDGATSMKKRKQAVESFQAGEGDVFLISLKAGGTGLNLTAADYVIHMDPWWNPAVEDQATDRAHRIGQQRPVNVYRLITKGTIEEKIVELHNTKRDLADNLLAGSESAGQLSTEDLIHLLKEGQMAAATT